MKPKRPSEKVMLSLCGELHPEDGVDPTDLPRSADAAMMPEQILPASRSRRFAGPPSQLPQKPGMPARNNRSRDHDRGHDGRKTRQLCRQVAHAIEDALIGSCDDDTLRCLSVVSVDPAPDESRLLVTVECHPSLGQVDPALALARVQFHAKTIRQEVAEAITRRRVPNLVYRYALQSDFPANPHK